MEGEFGALRMHNGAAKSVLGTAHLTRRDATVGPQGDGAGMQQLSVHDQLSRHLLANC